MISLNDLCYELSILDKMIFDCKEYIRSFFLLRDFKKVCFYFCELLYYIRCKILILKLIKIAR